MNKIYDYLKKVKVFYLASQDGDQARVRPLGALAEFEGRIYIVSSKEKTSTSKSRKP